MKRSLEVLQSSRPSVVHISRPSPLFSRLLRQNLQVLRLMLPRHLQRREEKSVKTCVQMYVKLYEVYEVYIKINDDK